MKAITVLAGSNKGNNPHYADTAAELARAIARRHARLVLGGASKGLMRICAETAHQHGVEVEVVIPERYLAAEPQPSFVRVTEVANEYMQRQAFLGRSQGLIALPGGPGTVEEVASFVSGRTYKQHNKPVVALAPDDFWTPLHWQFEALVRRGMAGANNLVCSPLPHVAVQLVLGP